MPSRPGLGLSAVPVPSHFSLPGIGGDTARGGTGERRGSSAGATAGTAGRQDRAARQPAPGARGQQGQPERARPGPRDPATRVGPGAEPPERLRPWRRGWHGRAHGWELYNLAAAPAGAREFPGRAGARHGGRLSPGSGSPAPPVGLPGLRRLHGPRTQAVPGRRGVRSASSARSSGAAIATHRGRRGSRGPPIRVAPSFPGEPCPAAARGHGRCARVGWGRLVLRLRRDRRRLPSSGLCCNVCEADFERLARRPPAAAALLPPPPSSRRPGPSPRCSTPFSSSAKFLNPFLPLPPIVTPADRVPGGSLELGSLPGSCRPSLRFSGWGPRGSAALKAERGRRSTGRGGGCLAPRAGALAFRPRPAAWIDCA